MVAEKVGSDGRQVQDSIGFRKISLPSLKISTSVTSKSLKGSLIGPLISSNNQPKPILTNSVQRKDALDVTILAPLVTIKPFKSSATLPTNNLPSERNKAVEALHLNSELFNSHDSRDDVSDSERRASYLISVEPPVNNSQLNDEVERNYLRLLDPQKMTSEEQAAQQKQEELGRMINKFKPIDATIEEKIETSKKSNLEGDSSNLRNAIQKVDYESGGLHMKVLSLKSRSKDKKMTDSLDVIRLNDERTSHKAEKRKSVGGIYNQKSDLAYSRTLENSSTEGQNKNKENKMVNISKFGLGNAGGYTGRISSSQHQNQEIRVNDFKDPTLNLRLDGSGYDDVNSVSDIVDKEKPRLSYSSQFNNSEYLDRELYRSSFDQNGSQRTPVNLSSTPLYKLELEERKQRKPRPDWQSENSSLNKFADFSSED